MGLPQNFGQQDFDRERLIRQKIQRGDLIMISNFTRIEIHILIEYNEDNHKSESYFLLFDYQKSMISILFHLLRPIILKILSINLHEILNWLSAEVSTLKILHIICFAGSGDC